MRAGRPMGRRGMALAALLLAAGLAACGGSVHPATPQASPLPVWSAAADAGPQRIVVLSDIHLGVDDAFSQTVQNRAMLVNFLDRLAVGPVDEIVLAGDILDEWYLPATYPASIDSMAFYRKVRANNAAVFAALGRIIDRGITLTYVPGNHDLLLDAETLADLLPGIRQARDAPGLGTRQTGTRSEIVIEHGHRYDAGACPDPLSNKTITGSYPSTLPFGYFFTRRLATAIAEGKTDPKVTVPVVAGPTDGTDDALGAYACYKLWAETITTYPISAGPDARVFATPDGYDRAISVRDLLPFVQADGRLAGPLYADVQRRWTAVQAANRVAVKIPYATAVETAFDHTILDRAPFTKYLDVDPTVDLVVFGHSHVPLVTRLVRSGRRTADANSGTWIDQNTMGPTGTFVAIESGPRSTSIRVLQYHADGSLVTVAE